MIEELEFTVRQGKVFFGGVEFGASATSFTRIEAAYIGLKQQIAEKAPQVEVLSVFVTRETAVSLFNEGILTEEMLSNAVEEYGGPTIYLTLDGDVLPISIQVFMYATHQEHQDFEFYLVNEPKFCPKWVQSLDEQEL